MGSRKGAEGTVTITAGDDLKPASKLIVFVTRRRPPRDNHYRAQINEVTVR